MCSGLRLAEACGGRGHATDAPMGCSLLSASLSVNGVCSTCVAHQDGRGFDSKKTLRCCFSKTADRFACLCLFQ
ncbi:unnamed protein product [Pieris brassicae]|uniref:Uncharacterized protein n=1 Tax=Pieris brassicae TaxID=7116 RepID=A0A9P0TIS1_PIEBR|nr:unnamed protein product [Pieris brassicae]